MKKLILISTLSLTTLLSSVTAFGQTRYEVIPTNYQVANEKL